MRKVWATYYDNRWDDKRIELELPDSLTFCPYEGDVSSGIGKKSFFATCDEEFEIQDKRTSVVTVTHHHHFEVVPLGFSQYLGTTVTKETHSKFLVLNGPLEGKFTADPGDDYAQVNRSGDLPVKAMWVHIQTVQETCEKLGLLKQKRRYGR